MHNAGIRDHQKSAFFKDAFLPWKNAREEKNAAPAGKRIALIGFPNAGKTTLFNALTGADERTGNWHGVTVDAASRRLGDTEIFDLPGIYGVYATSPEEKVTRNFINANPDALYVCVISAHDIPRGLDGAEKLLKSRRSVVVFTFYDEFLKQGGRLDLAGMEKALKKKVFALDSTDKRSVGAFARALLGITAYGKNTDDLRNAKIPEKTIDKNNGSARQSAQKPVHPINASAKKDNVESARQSAQKPAHPAGAFAEKGEYFPDIAAAKNCFTPPIRKESAIDRILFHPLGAIAAFLLAVFFVFYTAFGTYSPGALLLALAETIFDGILAAAERALAGVPQWLASLLCDGVLKGAFSVLSFLPQLSVLFLSLTLLEESGLMARFAFMSDGFFEKLGLNGRAFFSLFSGYGCTAVAALSTRSMEDKNLQRKTVLLLPFITCSARLPAYLLVINAVFSFAKPIILILLYLGGLALACGVSAVLNKTIYRKKAYFIMEMPPLRTVGIKKLFKALLYYAKQFIIRVGGIILAVTIALWFFSNFSFTLEYVGGRENCMLYVLGRSLGVVFRPMGIVDWRVSVSLLSGIFAKEAVAGTLLMLCGDVQGLFTPGQALAFLVFFSLYTPCLSALASIRREVGIRYALLSGVGMFAVALVAGYAAYFFSLHVAGCSAAVIAGCVVLLIAIFCRKKGCSTCGKCNDKSCKYKKNGAR